MKTRLFMCLGLVGLLALGAAAPGFAQNNPRGYQRQEQPQQYQQRQYQQRQYQQRQNTGQDNWRRGGRSAEEQDRSPRWQAEPNWRANSQGKQDNQDQYKQRQENKRQYDKDQRKYKKQDKGKRTPSSLLPEDEKRRTVIQQFMPHDRARQAVEAGEIRSYGDIRRSVQQRFNGRIVGMDLHENRGQGPAYVYDVRVLTQSGDVLSVDMDARTGQVLRVRGGR